MNNNYKHLPEFVSLTKVLKYKDTAVRTLDKLTMILYRNSNITMTT